MIPEARAAVVVASWRCGGTFLNYCLSNHPDIYCDRGEPMHRFSPWRAAMPGDPAELLRCVFDQRHYLVSMCKLTYVQAFHESVLPYLVKIKPAVIWLRRENVVRQAVSLMLAKRVMAVNPTARPEALHTWGEATATAPSALPAEAVLKEARALALADERARERLERYFPGYLELTYAQIIGGEGMTANHLPTASARRVCEFLSVPYQMLSCNLRRVNPKPLREMLANWPEVEAALQGSELAGHLRDEERWT